MADESSKRQGQDVSEFRRVDHTPPPLLIREGSLVVETDVDFNTRDTAGGATHRFRHRFTAIRKVMGLKILDDAGDTIYLNGDARNCSVSIWWKPPLNEPEQIFVDAGTFAVETDEELSTSSDTGHSLPKRTRRHTHPNGLANELLQVEVFDEVARKTLFFEKRRISQVMVWDTRD